MKIKTYLLSIFFYCLIFSMKAMEIKDLVNENNEDRFQLPAFLAFAQQSIPQPTPIQKKRKVWANSTQKTKKFRCPQSQCEGQLSREHSLKSHIERFHPKLFKKLFRIQCTCKKRFKNERAITVHISSQHRKNDHTHQLVDTYQLTSGTTHENN